MPPSDSDERDEDEREPSNSTTHNDSRRRGSGVRLEIGLRPVTDLLKGLVDADVSNPPPEPGDGRDDEHRHRTNREPTPRWSKPIKVRRKRARAESDAPRHESDSYYVTTHRSDDGVTIVADLPGVDEDDLSIGLAKDSNAFVIAVRGTVVRSVSLPWNRAAVSRARFNNAVLDVRLHPLDDADDAGNSVEG
jgi:HSP20 family molecular chaperone IbpA